MTASEQSPYVIEDQAKQPWLKTKTGKLTTLIVGGVIVLGATFAGGVAVGSAVSPQFVHELGIHAPFDRDGDHGGFNGGNGGQFKPGGQQPTPPASNQNG